MHIHMLQGMVVINGAIVQVAENADKLMELFELGSKSRHISSTSKNIQQNTPHIILHAYSLYIMVHSNNYGA